MTDNEALLDIVLSEIRGLKEAVDGIDHAIRGNGSPGLKQRVTAIESQLQQHKERDMWWRRLVGGAFVLGLPMVWDWLKFRLGWK